GRSRIWSLVWLFFFSSRRRHTRFSRDWSSDVCSSDLCPVFTQIDGFGKRNQFDIVGFLLNAVHEKIIIRLTTLSGQLKHVEKFVAHFRLVVPYNFRGFVMRDGFAQLKYPDKRKSYPIYKGRQQDHKTAIEKNFSGARREIELGFQDIEEYKEKQVDTSK